MSHGGLGDRPKGSALPAWYRRQCSVVPPAVHTPLQQWMDQESTLIIHWCCSWWTKGTRTGEAVEGKPRRPGRSAEGFCPAGVVPPERHA